MSCFDNIISINGDCGDESLSGLELFDAPEINLKALANTASETYVSGMELARKKLELAKKLVKNDVMGALSMNNAMPNLTNIQYNTSDFKTTTTYPAEAKERGLTLYKNKRINGSLRKTVIHTVKIFPLVSAESATLKVYDDGLGGVVSTYNVALTANVVNEFNIEYTIKGTLARVVLDGTDISVASAYLTCFTGCNGSMPNDCGYTKGWYDDKEISSKEGFGIGLVFSCKCDYEEFLCGLVSSFLGEIVWLKTRVLLLEEHLRIDRLNNWIIYNRDETKEYLVDVENQYRDKWNALNRSMPNLLKTYRDDCIQCRGTQWVTNI